MPEEPSRFEDLERKAPGSRAKETLEEKQLKMAQRHNPNLKNLGGNPNLKKGVPPYNIKRQSLENWLQDNPMYERKSPLKFAEAVRMFLEEKKNPHNPKSKTRMLTCLESLVTAASNPNNKNCVNACNLLFSYAHGKPKSADEDIDAIKKGGLTLVYVERPAVDPDIPVFDGGAQHALPPPEFVDAEVVEDDIERK